ncbi:diaminopimelate decarboxylase [Alkaliphilus peptidifermentans]|uniref:Diaminopimelate decarboxylase n=1 Tax=Alkaliphilus peptidifermentans DSM 18978 TaxID=1120976 RepID=A0A1G5IV81_9FIRM|nr:diaminopimelate decarboxylase [Alkaliphilus peptidifermentans]SCY80015.1 diaminopimelate decarboxylase [Alkaliphilus peptidifermentans DSM 18978]
MEIAEKVRTNFEFAGCDTVELAKEYGTPLYVVSEEKIREQCREITQSFLKKHQNTKATYASKAFLTLAMCKIIEEEGLGLDVVSGGELFTAVHADFPMEKIVFHGNNKSYEEIYMAVSHGVGRIVVDNSHELDMLEDITNELKRTVKILFRVSPGVKGETHEYILTGQKDSKFGIPLEGDGILQVVKKATNSQFLKLMGFHFHLGSQLFDKNAYILAIKALTNLMKELKDKLSYETQELNTGGGFGIYYTNGDKPKSIAYFTDAIMEELKIQCNSLQHTVPSVVIEPGRWIIGNAGVTLYTIGAVKEIPNVRTYVSVDGGLPDNPRPALYKAKYEAVIANKNNQPRDRVVTIAGKCCETGDILIWDLETPEINSGDILAVLSTGAYNYSMASNYNKLPKPAVVLVNKGKSDLIVKREKYEDLIRRDIIPKHLL